MAVSTWRILDGQSLTIYGPDNLQSTVLQRTSSTLTISSPVSITGNLTVSSGTITGDGSGLTNLNASNLATGTVPAARLANAVLIAPSSTQTITYQGPGVSTILKMAASPTANPFAIQNSAGSTVFAIDPTGAITTGTIPWGSVSGKPTFVNSLTAGTGIQLSGSTGNVTITNTGIISLQAGAGISVSGTNPAVITNTDPGSAQAIFKTIADAAGTAQFSASSNNDTLRFAAGGILEVTFDPTTRKVTYAASLNAGAGISITGSTVTNADPGSAQAIFKNVANDAGTVQFAAASNSDTLRFAAGSGLSVSFDPTTKKIAYANTGVTALTAGTGISVSGSTGSVTITNTGIISLAAGAGISVSGTNPATITNTDRGSAQNIFKNIGDGTTTKLTATSNNDTFHLVAGTDITLTWDTTNKKITIAAANMRPLAGTGISVSDRTVSVNFAGTGTATTAARSDHHHDTVYAKLTGNTNLSGTHVFTATQEAIRLTPASDPSQTILDEQVTLVGLTASSLANKPIHARSETVRSLDGTVTYQRDVDYTINYWNGTIARTSNSSIPDGATVKVSYKHTKKLFRITDPSSTNDKFGIDTEGNIYGSSITVLLSSATEQSSSTSPGDFTVQGNLIVDGSATLGNDAAADSTSIFGSLRVNAGTPASPTPVFSVDPTTSNATLTGTLTAGGLSVGGTPVALSGHIHDDRYFTETELSVSGGGGVVHWDNVTNKPTFVNALTAGTGISLSGSTGSVTITNTDRGSSQSIFKQVADASGTVQFSASSNNDTLRFAAGGNLSVSFDPATKKITYSFTESPDVDSITAGPGISVNQSTGAVTITNADPGSAQAIFKNIADAPGTIQFSASTNNDTLRFAGSGATAVSFDPTTKRVTIFSPIYQAGTGLSLSNNTFSINLTAGPGIAINGAQISTQNVLYTNPSTTQTITYGAASVSTILKMAASPTADPFIIQNSSGAAIFTVDKTGAISVGSIPWGSVTGKPTLVNSVSAGAGISVSQTTGAVTVTNADPGSAQSIFKQIADATGAVKFSATSNNDALRFAAGGDLLVSFDATNKQITYSFTESVDVDSITAGPGISVNQSTGNVTITNADPGSAQAIFKNIGDGTTTKFSASSNNDTFHLVAGTNIALSWDTTNKRVTIGGTGTWPNADTVDNKHASDFVLKTGDTVAGNLAINGVLDVQGLKVRNLGSVSAGGRWFKVARIQNRNPIDSAELAQFEGVLYVQDDFGNTASRQSVVTFSFGVRGGSITPVLFNAGSTQGRPTSDKYAFQVWRDTDGWHYLYFFQPEYSLYARFVYQAEACVEYWVQEDPSTVPGLTKVWDSRAGDPVQTPEVGSNPVWHAGNDGAGSTLDADLLDGQHGSFYQNASNLNAGNLNIARMPTGGNWDLTSNLTIETNLLTLDITNARVGVGTATPAYKLDIAGDVRWTGTLQGGSVPWARLTSIPDATSSAKGVMQVGTGLTAASGVVSVSFPAQGATSGWATNVARSDHFHPGLQDLPGSGVVYGLSVGAHATPDLGVQVAAGATILRDGYRYELAAPLDVALDGFVDGTNSRYVVLYVVGTRQSNPSNQIGVAVGPADGSLALPALPSGAIPLAKVLLTAQDTAITQDQITNIREMAPLRVETTGGDAAVKGRGTHTYGSASPPAWELSSTGRLTLYGASAGISTDGGSTYVNLSSKAPNWDLAHSYYHRHVYDLPQRDTTDPSGKRYQLAYEPAAGQTGDAFPKRLMVFKNGLLLRPQKSGESSGYDYTVANNAITFVQAPQPGDVILAFYEVLPAS